MPFGVGQGPCGCRFTFQQRRYPFTPNGYAAALDEMEDWVRRGDPVDARDAHLRVKCHGGSMDLVRCYRFGGKVECAPIHPSIMTRLGRSTQLPIAGLRRR